MASRFKGRDYGALREEIIDFLRQRLPKDWDYNNSADPVVIYAESLARMGDSLHFTIDELRRECDMATANRASSIYSYASREGYKFFLPRGSRGTIYVNSSKEMDDKLTLNINKFDEIKCGATGDRLYALNDIKNVNLHQVPDSDYLKSYLTKLDEINNSTASTNDKDKARRKLKIDYTAYSQTVYKMTQRIDVVLGSKADFGFTYGDINHDSTVDLPDPYIDRDLIRLTYRWKRDSNVHELRYVDDIIGAGFARDIYTLTPKFIGGAITLCIEFPTNYQDLFDNDASTTFNFEYIKISNRKIENDANGQNSGSLKLTDYISPNNYSPDALVVDIGGGIKGYTEYEDPNVTRENYKKFVQDYSALLTKDDYETFIKVTANTPCKVFDHADNYKENVLPEGTQLLPRVIYVLTDMPYNDREAMFAKLRERSSRSDCIQMVPYGKNPYTIIVKAECFLLGSTPSEIATSIKAALLQYYSGNIGEKTPSKSMIDYIIHKASDKVIRAENLILLDSTFGYSTNDFSNTSVMTNKDIDEFYELLKNDGIVRIGETIKYDKCIVPKLDGNGYIQRDSDDNIIMSDTLETFEVQTNLTNIYRSIEDFDNEKKINKFPEIYRVSSNTPVTIYDELAADQVIYGIFDSKDWDIKDTEIYKLSNNPTQFEQIYKEKKCDDTIHDVAVPIFYKDKDDVIKPVPKSFSYIMDPEYIKHHYVVPYLNQVVVMVKAVDKI